MENKSRLTTAIQELVCVFHEYASKDCHEGNGKEGKGACQEKCMDQFKLSKRELKELLHKELDMENINDPKKLDCMMKDLDENGDGQVDFQEFVVLVAAMSCACNDFLQMLLSEEPTCDTE